MRKVAIVGPVYPFRAGIAHCTTRLAQELERSFEVTVFSFKRQYPKLFYPGGKDIDESLRDRTPDTARFTLDVLNPVTWYRAGRTIRQEGIDVVILVWWIWVWAIPYLIIAKRSRAKLILQCHNVADKEPAWWKTALANAVMRRASWIVVHAASEQEQVRQRIGSRVLVARTFLPVHEMGGLIPDRSMARKWLDITAPNVALFFGHVRPFKGLDIALQAWKQLSTDVLLLVAGEIWWNEARRYRKLAKKLGDRVRFETRFIADSEIADFFSAADVVIAPYRREAQSGVAMTAFHFGRPVIATTVGGIPEMVEHGVNGLLVAPENPEELARAVDQFFSTSDRKAMEVAAQRTADRYSWKEYAAGVRGLIERII